VGDCGATAVDQLVERRLTRTIMNPTPSAARPIRNIIQGDPPVTGSVPMGGAVGTVVVVAPGVGGTGACVGPLGGRTPRNGGPVSFVSLRETPVGRFHVEGAVSGS
jgi:hypothetical protein